MISQAPLRLRFSNVSSTPEYEKKGKSLDENLKNVSVSVHFDDFKIGATHPYRHMINNPDGPGWS